MSTLSRSYLQTLVERLQLRGVEVAPGLAPHELEEAERVHGFVFPPDLRSLLAHALPVGDAFPDWRSPHSARLASSLGAPADGICFDVEYNAFWLDQWGRRPDDLVAALALARAAIARAPTLIPVYSHRYLPAVPCQPGNPVFSVHQSDIIDYGRDLPDYLRAEFGLDNPFVVPSEPRRIVLWSALL